MAAEVFAPRNPDGDLPTIVMSHGWGGKAEHLRPDAIAFAKAGYLVVAFDYRGWGKSDSRVVVSGKKPESKDGKLVAELIEVREIVDPIDQNDGHPERHSLGFRLKSCATKIELEFGDRLCRAGMLSTSQHVTHESRHS